MSKAENTYNKIRLIFLIAILAILIIVSIISGNKTTTDTNNETQNLTSISQSEAEKLVKNFINEKYKIKKDEIKLEIVETNRHYKDKICKEVDTDSQINNVSKTIKCDYDPNDLYYNFKFINGEYLDFNYFVNHFSKNVFEIDNTIEISEGKMVGEFTKDGKNRLQTYGFSNKSIDFILNIHETSMFTSFAGTAIKDIDGYKYTSPDLDFILNLDADNNLIINVTKFRTVNNLKIENISGTYQKVYTFVETNEEILNQENNENIVENETLSEENILE